MLRTPEPTIQPLMFCLLSTVYCDAIAGAEDDEDRHTAVGAIVCLIRS